MLLFMLPSPVLAAVEVTFFSREWGAYFPHAFVTLVGKDDRTGAIIDTNYGFTATNISPAILMGSVQGEIYKVDADYISKSDKHFSFTLTPQQLDAVLATVERWRTAKQPSYNLNRTNCVYFVADIAASLGMVADRPKPLMKKPRSFTEALTNANRAWLQQRGAKLMRLAPVKQPA